MEKSGNDKTARDWLHLQELLFDFYDSDLDRHRSPFVYRGLSNKDYELKTSLYRLQNNPKDLEGHLLRNFKKYAPQDSVSENNDWNWLAVAQHHGLPTRLLDWTFSPYVALHFMSEELDKYDEDGVIWCVDFFETRKLLPKKFKDSLDLKSHKAFSVDLLNTICPDVGKDLEKFENQHGEEFLLFFEPPSMDERIVNQFALFSVMSNPNTIVDEWLASHPHLFHRIIIPSKLKWEVRDKLDGANITERVIYPGLDGLCSWLKRWYSKK